MAIRAYNQRRGFSLVELMVSMSIISLFAATALPAMRTLYQSTAVKAETSDLIAALYFARGEAIKRHTTVSVCPSTDDRHCSTTATATDWRKGWIVRTADKILRISDKFQNQIHVADGGPAIIQYQPSGVSDLAAAAALNLCARNAQVGRQVKITRTGRPYSVDIACSAA